MNANLTLIVAMGRNRVIGRDNDMPWHLPSDLQFFKRVTMSKPLLMGRKTYESIGRPLPGRRSIVITGRADYRADGCEIAASLEDALALASSDAPNAEIIIGGGATLYEQTLARASRLYLTRVDAAPEGDTFFPPLAEQTWRVVWRQHQPVDSRHRYAYTRELLLPTCATEAATRQ